MKRKFAFIIITLSIAIILITITAISKLVPINNLHTIDYKTDSYSVQIPSSWKTINQTDYLTIFKYHGQKIASIEVNNNCQYTSSSSSIITNLFGLHGTSKGDIISTDKRNYRIIKTTITYEPSAAEKERNESEAPDELHYLYTDNKKLLIDLYLNTSLLSTHEQDLIAQSLNPVLPLL